MKRFILGLTILFVISGCGGWGGYVHKSDRYDFKFIFHLTKILAPSKPGCLILLQTIGVFDLTTAKELKDEK